jgi:hypothetical protein
MNKSLLLFSFFAFITCSASAMEDDYDSDTTLASTKLTWDQDGKSKFIVHYKEDVVNPPNAYFKDVVCDDEAMGYEQDSLITICEIMRDAFIEKNSIKKTPLPNPTAPSLLHQEKQSSQGLNTAKKEFLQTSLKLLEQFKTIPLKKINIQSYELPKNAKAKYDGPPKTEKAFIHGSLKLFDLFELLQRHQQKWKLDHPQKPIEEKK